MPFTAALFDMDGVIVDTEPLHRKAFSKTFDQYEIEVSGDLYTTFTGKTTMQACHELVDYFDLACRPEDLAQTKRHHFKHFFDTDPDFDLIPGIRDLLENYRENDIKMVVASSASMNTINWVFERFHLERYFMGKLSGADLIASKPHPEIFERAAKKVGEPHENCVVIEDSTNGIKAAHSAGIPCIAYKSQNSKSQDYALAQKVIADYREIYVGTGFFEEL